MMCQRIGRSPTSTKGLGRYSVSSRSRVPCPPHKITVFILKLDFQAVESTNDTGDLTIDIIFQKRVARSEWIKVGRDNLFGAGDMGGSDKVLCGAMAGRNG